MTEGKKKEVVCPITDEDLERLKELIWEAGDHLWGEDVKAAGESLAQLAHHIDYMIKKCKRIV